MLEDKKNNVVDSARYLAEQVRTFDGGVVYTASEAEIVTEDFKVPKHWPKAWALDVDGAKASILWAAHDRESDVLYGYAELVVQRHEFTLIANAIRTRGRDIPGLFDHLARKRSKPEGARIVDAMLDLHLEVFTVQCDPEAAVSETTRRLSTKRLKVFGTCTQWLSQYRAYRRDKDGDLVEESDGLMRAMDLLVMEGPAIAGHDPETVAEAQDEWSAETRSSVTGY